MNCKGALLVDFIRTQRRISIQSLAYEIVSFPDGDRDCSFPLVLRRPASCTERQSIFRRP
jgi:hypothetical protein